MEFLKISKIELGGPRRGWETTSDALRGTSGPRSKFQRPCKFSASLNLQASKHLQASSTANRPGLGKDLPIGFISRRPPTAEEAGMGAGNRGRRGARRRGEGLRQDAHRRGIRGLALCVGGAGNN